VYKLQNFYVDILLPWNQQKTIKDFTMHIQFHSRIENGSLRIINDLPNPCVFTRSEVLEHLVRNTEIVEYRNFLSEPVYTLSGHGEIIRIDQTTPYLGRTDRPVGLWVLRKTKCYGNDAKESMVADMCQLHNSDIDGKTIHPCMGHPMFRTFEEVSRYVVESHTNRMHSDGQIVFRAEVPKNNEIDSLYVKFAGVIIKIPCIKTNIQTPTLFSFSKNGNGRNSYEMPNLIKKEMETVAIGNGIYIAVAVNELTLIKAENDIRTLFQAHVSDVAKSKVEELADQLKRETGYHAETKRELDLYKRKYEKDLADRQVDLQLDSNKLKLEEQQHKTTRSVHESQSSDLKSSASNLSTVVAIAGTLITAAALIAPFVVAAVGASGITASIAKVASSFLAFLF
jgi:hypothetical protein